MSGSLDFFIKDLLSNSLVPYTSVSTIYSKIILKREFFKHTGVNGISPSNPSPQSSANPMEEKAEGV